MKDPCVPVDDNTSGDVDYMKNISGTDEDLDTDLIGTGLLPDTNNEDVIQIDGNANVVVTADKEQIKETVQEETKENKLDIINSEHGEQTKMDVSEMENSERNKMDISDRNNSEENNQDFSDRNNSEQNKMDISDGEHANDKNPDVTDSEHAEENKTDVNESETEWEEQKEKGNEREFDGSIDKNKDDIDNNIKSTSEEDETGSMDDSGTEEDGWQSESKQCEATLRAKKQTETFKMLDGSLSLRRVGYSKRVAHKKQHKCHLCGETFEMQCNFTKHYATKHPDNPFKCEHCGAVLQTPNGLFKHQRSHLYLKHECSDCGKRFQFPRQRDNHLKIHTGQELYPCLHCDQKFTLNTMMLTHAKTHNTQLVCELCPKTTTKIFNSQYGLAQHVQGMHKGGWDGFCGKNFKWKSRYSCHLKKCEICKAEKLCIKKQWYLFDT